MHHKTEWLNIHDMHTAAVSPVRHPRHSRHEHPQPELELFSDIFPITVLQSSTPNIAIYASICNSNFFFVDFQHNSMEKEVISIQNTGKPNG